MLILQRPNDLPKDYYIWFELLNKIILEKKFHKLGIYAKKLESFTSEELWKITLNNMKTISILKGKI